MKVGIPVHALVFTVLFGCSAPDAWTGFVYPDRENLRDSVSLGSFKSKIRCAAASIDVLDRIDALDRGDYECGLNCKRDEDLPALLVCDSTEKPLELGSALNFLGFAALEVLHRDCLARIADLHRREFLTIPGKLRVRLGLADKPDRDAYVAFAEAVECLGSTSTDVVPKISMDPGEFRIIFNIHSEKLGLPFAISR